MKNLTSHKIRSFFLFGGVAAMMGVTMLTPQAAHADKADNYKYGAAALGILGAILGVKGKTLPAVLAGAGAYYAYEKGRDLEKEEQYDNRYNRGDRDHRWDNDRRDRDDRWNDRNDRDNRWEYNRNDRNDRNDRWDNDRRDRDDRWNDRRDRDRDHDWKDNRRDWSYNGNSRYDYSLR